MDVLHKCIIFYTCLHGLAMYMLGLEQRLQNNIRSLVIKSEQIFKASYLCFYQAQQEESCVSYTETGTNS